jgi:hypothetical protein
MQEINVNIICECPRAEKNRWEKRNHTIKKFNEHEDKLLALNSNPEGKLTETRRIGWTKTLLRDARLFCIVFLCISVTLYEVNFSVCLCVIFVSRASFVSTQPDSDKIPSSQGIVGHLESYNTKLKLTHHTHVQEGNRVSYCYHTT